MRSADYSSEPASPFSGQLSRGHSDGRSLVAVDSPDLRLIESMGSAQFDGQSGSRRGSGRRKRDIDSDVRGRQPRATPTLPNLPGITVSSVGTSSEFTIVNGQVLQNYPTITH